MEEVAVAKQDTPCSICLENAEHLYRLVCACQICPETPLCAKCLGKHAQNRQHVAPLFPSAEYCNTSVFAYINDKACQCPHTKMCTVRKFAPYGSTNDAESAIVLPLPYGWIGDRPFMTKKEYDLAVPIFERKIQPYFKDYNHVIKLYQFNVDTNQKATNAADRERRDRQLQSFIVFVRFCNCVFKGKEWQASDDVSQQVQISDSDEAASTSALDEYAKQCEENAFKKLSLAINLAEVEYAKENKENSPPP
jgi:hypothetical protein